MCIAFLLAVIRELFHSAIIISLELQKEKNLGIFIRQRVNFLSIMLFFRGRSKRKWENIKHRGGLYAAEATYVKGLAFYFCLHLKTSKSTKASTVTRRPKSELARHENVSRRFENERCLVLCE